MSVLETPRLYFRGEVSWDPIVTNNSLPQYDQNDARPVFSPRAPDVARFREDAIASVLTGGNWNPHGTHRSSFFNTTVVGVDIGDGVTGNDPMVKAPVSFTGMLVDAEAYGTDSSQLFFDKLGFGIQGGSRILAPRSMRMTARYLNFGRNTGNGIAIAGVASVVWQTSFKKTDGLSIEPHDSTVLARLAEALKDDSVLGLTVRWNAYRTTYYGSEDASKLGTLTSELNGKLGGGGFQPNPARSKIVGVVGLWRKGEPGSEPGERALLPVENSPMASAHARVTGDRLTLDLANSISETGIDLTKADLGVLKVVAIGPDGKTVIGDLGSLSPSDYEKSAYEESAGIITRKLAPAIASAAQASDLQLRAADGTVLLQEARLRALPDKQNIYLDIGEREEIKVQVMDRGQPAGAGKTVTMVNAQTALASPLTSVTDASGIASFKLVGRRGQFETYLLSADGTIPDRLDPGISTYVGVRTLPGNRRLAGLPPTWDNVYRAVLRNWHALAPCMDNWLDLGDKNQVTAFAPLLRRLTDKTNLESFRYMPVTRDMTADQRDLLHRYLDTIIGPADRTASGPAIAAVDREQRLMKTGPGPG